MFVDMTKDPKARIQNFDMGRQAFLTRLALGRSAFQLPAIDTPGEGDAVKPPSDNGSPPEPRREDAQEVEPSNVTESTTEGRVAARSGNSHQQYDKKGYPENLSSRAAKRRWRHAVNDILATVGVCVAKGQEPPSSYGADDPLRVLEVRSENDYGIYISAADAMVRFMTECWTTALRQRLQTFKYYAGVPLIEIIKIEWNHFGRFQFLFAGGLSSLVFLLLDATTQTMTIYAFDTLKGAPDDLPTSDVRVKTLKDTAFKWAKLISRFTLFVLITPIEIYGVLQRLDLITAWPVLPFPRAYASGLLAVFVDERLGYIRAEALTFLAYIYFRRHNRLGLKIFDYVWAALPKPIRPDRFSLIGAKADDLDMSSIPGLLDDNDLRDERVSTSFNDQLAHDLRVLRREWEVFYDRCAGALSWRSITSLTPLRLMRLDAQLASGSLRSFFSIHSGRKRHPQRILTPNTQQERTQCQQEHIESLALGDETETSAMTVNREVLESGYVQDPRNHISPPPPSPLSTSPSHSSNIGLPSRSNDSSPVSSLVASPQPIDLNSHDENGEVLVNLTIPTPARVVDQTTIAEGEHRASASVAWRDSDSWPDGSLEPPLDNSRIHQHSNPSESIAGSRLGLGPHHRVTALSAYPAEHVALRLSSLIMITLCLPLEALFVRSVAMAFLSSPMASPASEAAAARWKKEVYPVETWFGSGLRVGGLKGVGEYIGKMLLFQGLEAGVEFVSWQVWMGAVWWIGRPRFVVADTFLEA